MAQQTSVEWLINQLYKIGLSKDIHPNNILFSKAKEIHKEQIEDAYNQGFRDALEYCGNDINYKDEIAEQSNAEDYYNKTFNKD